ncbi:MAG: hypothetical protein O3C20_21265 [Verrucomicrobia bacterium]|nr:hypothetical protein [Verrucomicrobiota bacterium]
MKKFSTVLIILAVLNPLCCCITFAETLESTNSIQDHGCCPGDQQEAEGQKSTDCQHKSLSNEDARIAEDQSNFVTHFVAQTDKVIEVLNLASLQNSHARILPNHIPTVVRDAWIHTQTDCVRLL